MTHEQTSLTGQAQQPGDQLIKGMRIAAREIRPGRATVWHEQGITDKGCIANDKIHTGSCELKRVDFRLICSTHKDIFSMVRADRFRQDLYCRIKDGKYQCALFMSKIAGSRK